MNIGKAGRIMSFRRGWQRLRAIDMPQVKEELMDALGINNRNSWGLCLGKGKPMTEAQRLAVEAVFGRHDVKPADVWDTPGRVWDVVISEKVGVVRLVNLDENSITPFGSIEAILTYARHEGIPLPPPWSKAE